MFERSVYVVGAPLQCSHAALFKVSRRSSCKYDMKLKFLFFFVNHLNFFFIKGKRKVLVFHFRSGFVIRVDDHEKMMHLVTVFMSEALDKGTLSNINRVPIWKGLLAIFWPGPSSIGMTGVDKKLPYPIPSPFLQKRLMVAMGAYIIL